MIRKPLLRGATWVSDREQCARREAIDAMSQIDLVRRVAVIGLGTMGHGIAQTFALAGYEVGCFDESTTARTSLCERVGENLAAFVQSGLIEPQAVEPALAPARRRHPVRGGSRRSICDRSNSRRPRAQAGGARANRADRGTRYDLG